MESQPKIQRHHHIPLLAFQAFGFAPIGSTPRKRFAAECISVAAVLLVIVNSASPLFLAGSLVQTNALQTIVATLIFGAEVSTNLVALVQAWLTRHTLANFIAGIRRIDGIMQQQIGQPPTARGVRLVCAAGLTFGVMIAELLYAWQRNDSNAWRFKLQLIYPMTANRMRCVQTLYFADALRWRLGRLAVAIADSAEKRSGATGVTDLRERLRHLRRVYAALWSNAQRLNGCFGWSLLTITVQLFVNMTAQGYWVFLALQGQLPATQYAESALGIAAGVLALLLLCEWCNECEEEVHYWSFLCLGFCISMVLHSFVPTFRPATLATF